MLIGSDQSFLATWICCGIELDVFVEALLANVATQTLDSICYRNRHVDGRMKKNMQKERMGKGNGKETEGKNWKKTYN